MEKYLLDTHTFLWYLENNPSLNSKTRQIIANEENQLFISIVSFWEIAIKIQLNKLELPEPFEGLFEKADALNIRILPVKEKYLSSYLSLEFHHRDPFDRMIVATAISEEISVLSKDANLKLYNIKLFW